MEEPQFQINVTGAIFGVVAAQQTGDSTIGLTIAVTLSLLMTQLDIMRRAATTAFIHVGDKKLAQNNIKGFELWTLLGMVPKSNSTWFACICWCIISRST